MSTPTSHGMTGSGWTWLAQDSAGKLKIVKTSNADLPVTEGLNPLLVVDVWVRLRLRSAVPCFECD